MAAPATHPHPLLQLPLLGHLYVFGITDKITPFSMRCVPKKEDIKLMAISR